MEIEAVRTDLLVAFDYSCVHDDWVCPVAEALDGVAAEEAAWKSSPEAMGIWEIVLHMAAWNENMVERIEKGEIVSPPEGHWPPLPDTLDEAIWVRAKERLNASLVSLRSAIETTPMTKLMERPTVHGTWLDDVLCRLIHNAYHLGQIVKLREHYSTLDIEYRKEQR